MRIKTKLNLAVGLLFLLIIVLSLLSAYYIYSIKKDTQNILKANYETLEYSRNMLMALDIYEVNQKKSISDFEKNLNKQYKNCTETGEKKATKILGNNFELLKKDSISESLKSNIHQNIFEIMKLNMDAIKLKSDVAKKTSETANFWIIVIGTLCFLIAFNLLINVSNRFFSSNNLYRLLLLYSSSFSAIVLKDFAKSPNSLWSKKFTLSE